MIGFISQPLWNGVIFIICTYKSCPTQNTKNTSPKTQALTNNYFIGWILIVLEFVIQSQCFDVDNGYKLLRNHLINWVIGSKVFKLFLCVFSYKICNVIKLKKECCIHLNKFQVGISDNFSNLPFRISRIREYFYAKSVINATISTANHQHYDLPHLGYSKSYSRLFICFWNLSLLSVFLFLFNIFLRWFGCISLSNIFLTTGSATVSSRWYNHM